MWTPKSKLFLTQSLWHFRQRLHGHLVGFWKRGLGKRLWERAQKLIPSNPKILWLAENKTYILSAPSLPNNNSKMVFFFIYFNPFSLFYALSVLVLSGFDYTMKPWILTEN